MIWIANSEGKNIFINQAWQQLTGRDIAESMGDNWVESVHPHDASDLLAKWERAYKHGESYNGECRFKAKDGSYRTLTFIGVPVRDNSGKIVNWVGINLDITDRKRMEDALRESHDKIELKIKERTIELNKTNDALWAEITDRKQAQKELERYRYRLEDIVKERTSQLVATQEQLIQKERLAILGQLAACVSHELRNPPGVIRNSAECIKIKISDKPEVEKALNRMDRNITRCNKIIEELLELCSQASYRIKKHEYRRLVGEYSDRV